MKRMKPFFGLIVLASMIVSMSFSSCQPAKPKHTFEIGKDDFLIDGQPFQIRCGEMHFARVPKEYWRHRLQMTKALGMNTICAYLFWNYHERTPGEFTWEGQADVAEFCEMAQEEGLWVILRPGPYACAEWEMGGLPWWLLKYDDIALRSTDPRYVEASQRYLKEVGRVLGPQQITNGGPILMVQVENEYGFYSDDAEYMGVMRQAILDAGFNVPLFSCNPKHTLKRGYRDDLFPVVNFGADPADGFAKLREILPEGPLMCGEFYSGWFDTWGTPHTFGNTEAYLRDMEYMLKEGASFSIYMAHGGTSFGFWGGADRPFKPDCSSYDYGAPISEAGLTTPKFFETQELISRYLMPGEEALPEPPAPMPSTTFEKVTLSQFAPLFDNLPEPVVGDEPKNMEYYDQARGSMVYRTTLSAGPACTFSVGAANDFAWVYVDGEEVGLMDRRKRNYSVTIPAREQESTVEIFVHAMGRINFGKEVHDRKGLNAPVTFKSNGQEIKTGQWEIFNLDYNDQMLAGLKYSERTEPNTKPGIWKGSFTVDKLGDTYLDVSTWGKGVVWVNGHALGRYWNIGPTQTMFIPAPWLKKGENEILILDIVGPQAMTIEGVETPVLDQLKPENDFSGTRRNQGELQIKEKQPVLKASFKPGGEAQTVKFDKTVKGRLFCLEALNAMNGDRYAAIAEFDILDAKGKAISHENWTIAYVSSEESSGENGIAENAIDGQTFNFWHTSWSITQPEYPHHLVIDLGVETEISGFVYVPRMDDKAPGRIKDYQVFIGNDLVKK
ncbi:beta-galactosidase [Carboxylicivirga caseinilyticus]|uniref:beta-galactosidase n=1 Tax=Carboxylicivirga caseinilyticus TaxID=3417572 RepID=UPI003D355B10|nr:beta-galactosidase [Marinilabiliaceae bacterium A049]